jgi:hypothetical protein
METELVTLYRPSIKSWWQEYLDDCDFTIKRKYKWLDKSYQLPIVGGDYIEGSPKSFEGPIKLILVDDNKFDPNAIAVEYCGKRVGWVPRERTHLLRKNWDDFVQSDDEWDNFPKVVSSNELFLYLLGIHG